MRYMNAISTFQHPFSHWTAWLTASVDGAGLAYFRIVFGLVLVWDTWVLLDKAWVERTFFGHRFHFTYWPFDFVAPLPGDWMYAVILVMAVLALAVTLGFMYRVAALLLFVVTSYIFLTDQTNYLNHWYLVCLLSAVLAIVPAHRCWSLDAHWSKPRPTGDVPRWSWYLLLFQMAVPMSYGGIAKLNADWLRGEPLRMWLSDDGDFPLLGPLFAHEPVVWLMVYGAIALDLFFVGYMTNRRLRVFGFGALLCFHLMNDRLWHIGIFPWMMIAATPVFFGPGWPRLMYADLMNRHPVKLPLAIAGALAAGWVSYVLPLELDYFQVAVGAFGGAVFGYFLVEPFSKGVKLESVAVERATRFRWQPWVATGIGLWMALQLLVPMRHYLIDGNVSWTEDGHMFSWHMMLRSKQHAYPIMFSVVRADHPDLIFFLDPSQHLTPRQHNKMSGRPDMIWQYVRFVADEARKEGWGPITVHADVQLSLNGREMQRYIDTNTDLLSVPRPGWGVTLTRTPWITEMTQPFRNTARAQVMSNAADR